MENIDPRAIMDEVTAEVRANLKTLCREQYVLSNTAVLPPDALTRKIAAKAAVAVKSEALRVVQRLIETEAMNAIAGEDEPAEEPKTDKEEEEEAWAFWPYDQYPYFVGGLVSKTEDNRVYVPAFQSWRRLDDGKTVVIRKDGRNLKNFLAAMDSSYRTACDNTRRAYTEELRRGLPDNMRSMIQR